MTPIALVDLLAADPIARYQAAIADRLAQLLPDITVKTHPGKVSISQLDAKAIMATPGIAVGWSRVRDASAIDGTVAITVDWIAYVVTEHKVIGGRRVEREALALAIGFALLGILADPTAATWGVPRIAPPAEAPPAQLSPVFTIADQAEGTSYLAVTWSQTIVDQAPGLFEGAAPALSAALDGDGRASAEADFGPGDGAVPIAVRALWSDPA
jgi:hypothetical protein